MLSGGPTSVIWCWLAVSFKKRKEKTLFGALILKKKRTKNSQGIFGTLMMGTAVAELISAYPSDGGLYSASSYLVPHKYKKVVGFLVGWIFILGQMSVICSVGTSRLPKQCFICFSILR